MPGPTQLHSSTWQEIVLSIADLTLGNGVAPVRQIAAVRPYFPARRAISNTRAQVANPSAKSRVAFVQETAAGMSHLNAAEDSAVGRVHEAKAPRRSVRKSAAAGSHGP